MSKPRSTRTRKEDLRAQRAEEKQTIAERKEQRRAPKALPERDADAPILETDDLLALANMDPSELAALMDGAVAGDALEPGTSVRGVVTRIANGAVLVDIGGKAEAWIDPLEVPDAKKGDAIEAFIVWAGESEVKLSKTLSGAAADAFLEEAHASGIPVEGHVTGANPGGFDVRVGDTRAFCPRSLMSRHYVEEPAVFVGQTLQFKVIELGEKTVVSRRAVEEELAEKNAEQIWERVSEGMELEGTVRNVQSFGAFVDVGGVDGLVPRSELSWDPGADPTDLIHSGEPVTVRVIRVDREAKKLTFSLKNPDQAPWRRVGEDFVEGGIYSGQVARLTTFGAFIRLADGLDGLLHVSKMGEGIQQGSTIDVRILSIDTERRRISLARADDTSATAAVGATAEAEEVEGSVAEVMRNGLVLSLEDGRTAWLPASEVELPAGTVLAQRYRRGKRITARVKDASRPDRLVLTTRAASNEDWRQAVRQQKPAKKESFGTFGDLFAGLDLSKK